MENNYVIVNCPTCKVNRLAEIIFTHYEPGKIFIQTLQCTTCCETDILLGKIEVKLDLSKEKEVSHVQHPTTGQFDFPVNQCSERKQTTLNHT